MAPKQKPVSDEERSQIIILYTGRVRGFRKTNALARHFGIDKVRVERILSDAGVWEGDRRDVMPVSHLIKSDEIFTAIMEGLPFDYSGPRSIFHQDTGEDQGPWEK